MDFLLNKRLLIFAFCRFSILLLAFLTPYLILILKIKETGISKVLANINTNQSTIICPLILLFLFKCWVLSKLYEVVKLWQNRKKPRISLDKHGFKFIDGSIETLQEWDNIQKSSYSEYTYNGIRHESKITFTLLDNSEQSFSLLFLSEPKKVYDQIVSYWQNLSL